MVFNTATVGAAVAPAVIGTFISHYLHRKSLAQKPTAHISYDEGLHLIRQFLLYTSHHTVEDVQRFTAQWVPHPRWVKVEDVTIGQDHIRAAAEAIQSQLGHHGIERVGGKTWWQWRRPGSELKAEWIEMRSDYLERKTLGQESKRVMLYVHGGAYFFGSVDEHRYQMQRHARKLKARVLAPQYRLAPQFPFPCGLHDCLAAYLYLLTVQDPSTIILAGDSAGGGMILSVLVILRDRGLPLPAGAILISPWVDLTHSFPSVAGDNPLDYIPARGFHARPSPAWPPPNSDDMLAMAEGVVKKLAHNQTSTSASEKDAIQGFHISENPAVGTKNDDAASSPAIHDSAGPTANTVPGHGHALSIMIDGILIEIKDQIQMYASNQLISHPLVSPILQPSLGGLPPLLILTGGGEALRDEQIYLAHKAANPQEYPPGDAFLDENPHDHNKDKIGQWKPTDVQLQVWDDLCHVAPTLSFTKPAKYMYRSVAQFGAWALARAQHTEIDILDDDNVSVISKSESGNELEVDDNEIDEKREEGGQNIHAANSNHVGKAGDPLPPFKNHMIRQRVTRHGVVYPLEPASQLPACTLPPSQIGVIKEGPVRKWMSGKREWDTKYASSKRRVQKRRAKEMMEGYRTFGDGEVPPPSALAGRRRKDEGDREEKAKKSWGLSLWSKWGSKHDEMAKEREEQMDREPETITVTEAEGANSRPLHDIETKEGEKLKVPRQKSQSRSRPRRKTVTDRYQTENQDEDDEIYPLSSRLAGKAAEEGLKSTDEFPSQGRGRKSPRELLTADTTEQSNSIQDVPIAAVSRLSAERELKAEEANYTLLPSSTQSINEPAGDEQESVIEVSKTNRPKSNGVAFPFTLKRNRTQTSVAGSMTSTQTLTSTLGVAPAEDVRTTRTLQSNITETENDENTLGKEASIQSAEIKKQARGNKEGKKATGTKESSFKNKWSVMTAANAKRTVPEPVVNHESALLRQVKANHAAKQLLKNTEAQSTGLETVGQDSSGMGVTKTDSDRVSVSSSQRSIRDYVFW